MKRHKFKQKITYIRIYVYIHIPTLSLKGLSFLLFYIQAIF